MYNAALSSAGTPMLIRLWDLAEGPPLKAPCGAIEGDSWLAS